MRPFAEPHHPRIPDQPAEVGPVGGAERGGRATDGVGLTPQLADDGPVGPLQAQAHQQGQGTQGQKAAEGSQETQDSQEGRHDLRDGPFPTGLLAHAVHPVQPQVQLVPQVSFMLQSLHDYIIPFASPRIGN